MLLKWLIFIGLSLACTISVNSTRYFFIKWTNYTLTTYSEKIEGFNVKMTVFNNVSVLSGYLILNEDIEKMKIRNIVDIPLTNGNLRRIFDYSLDICRLVKMPPNSSVATIIWNDIAQHGNVPKKCPIPAHENFTLTDYNLDAEYFPPFSSELTLIIQTTIFLEDKLAASIETVAKIESKRRKSP